MRLPALAAALCAMALPAAHAQESAGLSYRWVEGNYGVQYVMGSNDVGNRAPGTLRLAGNVELVPHLYLLGSYTSGENAFQTIDMISAGVGGHLPLGPTLHGIAHLTVERIEGDIFTSDGFGLETGVRWLAAAAELDLTAEYSRLELDYLGKQDDSFVGFNLAAIVPASEALALTVRIEKLFGNDGPSETVSFDTYLVGLRYCF